MNTQSKKLEFGLYTAVILASAAIGIFIGITYLAGDKKKSIPPVTVGAKLQLDDINRSGNDRTLVLVLSERCRFCSESAEFYRQLVQRCVAKNVRVVAVLPETASEGRQYLSKLGVPVDEVKQARFGQLGVVGTPTLILVNPSLELKKGVTAFLPA